jgi:hypothetical protein
MLLAQRIPLKGLVPCLTSLVISVRVESRVQRNDRVSDIASIVARSKYSSVPSMGVLCSPGDHLERCIISLPPIITPVGSKHTPPRTRVNSDKHPGGILCRYRQRLGNSLKLLVSLRYYYKPERGTSVFKVVCEPTGGGLRSMDTVLSLMMLFSLPCLSSLSSRPSGRS